jgi:hypothetical protein
LVPSHHRRRHHAGWPWLRFYCPACRQIGEADLRKINRHRGATIESLISLFPAGTADRIGRQPITFAALWSIWNNTETGEYLQYCTMIITEPNKFVAEVHDRIPVILETRDFEQWEHGDPKDEAAMMKAAAESAKVAGVETCEQFARTRW